MNIALDDLGLTATIQDWDATDWASESSAVPDSYTLIFQPSVDEATLLATITNRQLAYTASTMYEAQPFGAGYVSIPKLFVIQTMLPVPVVEAS